LFTFAVQKIWLLILPVKGGTC